MYWFKKKKQTIKYKVKYNDICKININDDILFKHKNKCFVL